MNSHNSPIKEIALSLDFASPITQIKGDKNNNMKEINNIELLIGNESN